jgi:hypothetical protein
MTKILGAVLVSFLLFVAACTGPQVQIETAPGTTPESFRTFVDVRLPDQYRPQSLNEVEEWGEEILRARMVEQLVSRGYRRVSSLQDNPDVVATVFVSYRLHEELDTRNGFGDFDYPDTWRTYAEGSVVFLIADPRTRRVIWQATYDRERFMGEDVESVSFTEADLQAKADEVMTDVLEELAEDQRRRGIDPGPRPPRPLLPPQPADPAVDTELAPTAAAG